MSTSTCTSAAPTTITLADLREAMKKLEAIPPCPILTYMKAHGFNPDDGCYMAVPESFRDKFGPFGPPYYVRVTDLVTDPTLVRDSTRAKFSLLARR